MADERRRAPRVALKWTVSYSEVATARKGTSLVKNFSSEGVRFVAEHTLEIGTELQITLALPDRHKPVEFVGEVVWSSDARTARDTAVPFGSSEVGVKFTRIDPKERALLMQYAMMYGSPSA